MNRYKSYKKVDLHWLNQVPTHWELTRIKRLFYIHKDCSGTDLPIILTLARDRIKIRDISDNAGQLAADYTNYNKVKIGDLILNPMDLYSGPNCNISYVEGVISPAYTKLRKKKELYEKYFDYCFKLQYILLAFQAVGKGVSKENRWTLNNETLLNYLIPIPPLPEQKQIANYLDWKVSEIDKLIYLEKEKIKQTESLKKSIIAKAVTQGLVKTKMKSVDIDWIKEIPSHWDIEKIKMFSSFGVGSSISDHKKDNYKDSVNAIPYISTANISLDNQKINYLSGLYIKKLDSDFEVIPTGSTLVCIEGGSGGKKKAITDREVCIVNKLCYIKSFKHDDMFIYFLILSDYFNNQYNSSISGDRNGVSVRTLGEFKFPTPPLPEQKQIANYLNKKIQKIDEINTLSKEKIQKLVALKQSLISEIVTGQIDVQNIKIPKYEKVTNIDDAEAFND